MNVTIPELAQRQRVTLPLFELASRIAELETEDPDLLGEIAEAEERGDWRQAAALRSRYAVLVAAFAHGR